MSLVKAKQKRADALAAWKKATLDLAGETDATKRSAMVDDANAKKAAYEQADEEFRNAEALDAAERAAAADFIETSAPQAQPGEASRSQRTTPRKTEEEKLLGDFKLLRAVQQIVRNGKLEGAEKEAFEEATHEAQQRGSIVQMEGNIRVPTFMARSANEQRSQTVGTAGDGGNTVATNLGQLQSFFQPRLTLQRLGTQVMTGLSANMEFPVESNMYDAVWDGENSTATEVTSTFTKKAFTPKRLSAFTRLSRSWINQNSFPAEAFARDRMNLAVGRKLDSTGINGSGTGNIPLGILGTSGIGSVAMGTNGAAPTWASMIALWKEVAIDDADFGTLAYLTTPGIAAQLMQTEKAASTGQFVWTTNTASGQVNGYNAETSTLVPSTLTKGSSTDCNAILFGNFNQFLMGQWGGLDMIVNPFSEDKEAFVRLTIHSYWDMLVLNAKAFAAIKDARVTI